MNLFVVLGLVAGMVVLRFLKPGLLVWMGAIWVALYLGVRYGLTTPAPQSVVTMYMSITTLALVAYVASSAERMRSVLDPITGMIADRRRTPLLAAVALVVPALVGISVYRGASVREEPPYFARTVHPAPPPTVTVGSTEIDLIRGRNPFRELETAEPERFKEHVAKGREVYYRNCFYCHGDSLAGDGMFARGLDPIPTNLTDAGVLPNFQETFFFWRVAKGGPGMPEEGGPWESAMPRWEKFLSEEEMWDVILFLYDFTGRTPREAEEIAHQ
ncbi:MAG: c-type cytochrome [Candidatus Polarisedimenticolia bacterium]